MIMTSTAFAVMALVGAVAAQAEKPVTSSAETELTTYESDPGLFAARCVAAAHAQRNRVRAGTDFYLRMNNVSEWWQARLVQDVTDEADRAALSRQAEAEIAPYDRPGMEAMVAVGAVLAPCRETRARLSGSTEE